MVKSKKSAKELATQRRSDRKDKEYEIDGLLSDTMYIQKVSAVASAHSGGSGLSQIPPNASVHVGRSALTPPPQLSSPASPSPASSSSSTAAPSPLTFAVTTSQLTSPTTILADAAKHNKNNNNKNVKRGATSHAKQNAQVHVHVESDEEEEDDGFASCVSEAATTATAATTTASAANRRIGKERLEAQYRRDAAAFPWYGAAMEALNAADAISALPPPPPSNSHVPSLACTSTEEGAAVPVAEPLLSTLPPGAAEVIAEKRAGYAAYLLKVNGTTDLGSTDNPYVLPQALWWSAEKARRVAVLNADLAKEKRLLKTGSERHQGTAPSAKTREQQKIKGFTLSTSNRFGGFGNKK